MLEEGDGSSREWPPQDFPGGSVAKALHSQCRGPVSTPGQRTRIHMPQLRAHMPQLRQGVAK